MASATGSPQTGGPRRRLPGVRTLLLATYLAVLLLPVGGIAFLRLYESALIRQTEAELLAQAAVLSAAYRAAWLDRASHEALAVDPGTGSVYLTEDSGNNSGFYKFVPTVPGDLAQGGLLYMLRVRSQKTAANLYTGQAPRVPSLRRGDAQRTISAMSDDRPPVTDAEFRVVRGPWPRWAFHMGLVSLAIRTTAVVAACMLAALGLWMLLT